MAILQRLLARRGPGAALDVLLRAAEADSGVAELQSAIDAGERARDGCPEHFGLTFALGIAHEVMAGRQSWEERGDWLERAARAYEAAIDLADAGKLAGAGRLPDVAPEAWESGLGLEARASLAACYRAGLLRAGEFRVRDPGRGARQLRRVVDRLRGYHPAWYYLGEAHLLAGGLDAAEAAWREGLARSPGDSALLDVLAKLPVDRVRQAAKDGDWQRVLADLARLPAGAMPAAERLIIEGDAYRALGCPGQARRSWEAALAADRRAVGVRGRLRQLAT